MHFYFIPLSKVRLGPLGTAVTTGLLYQPQMIDDCDCGEIGGMKVVRRNRTTRRKPAPLPLCSSQIPHDLSQARTWAATVGSRCVTAWPMAWLFPVYLQKCCYPVPSWQIVRTGLEIGSDHKKIKRLAYRRQAFIQGSPTYPLQTILI
jgi:hypothetical protein